MHVWVILRTPTHTLYFAQTKLPKTSFICHPLVMRPHKYRTLKFLRHTIVHVSAFQSPWYGTEDRADHAHTSIRLTVVSGSTRGVAASGCEGLWALSCTTKVNTFTRLPLTKNILFMKHIKALSMSLCFKGTLHSILVTLTNNGVWGEQTRTDWTAKPGNHCGFQVSSRKSPQIGCYEVGDLPEL